MAKSHIDQFVESIVGRFAGDLWAVVMQNGMTLDEYERHVGVVRRGVEDEIRAARVALMGRLERKGAGNG